MGERTPAIAASRSCVATTGPTMPAALAKEPKTSDQNQGGDVGTVSKPPDPGARPVVPQCRARGAQDQADVIVRAGVDAIETERAVHVASLARLVEMQFATGNAVAAADAVFRPAGGADGWARAP